jgi:hypothetical protein
MVAKGKIIDIFQVTDNVANPVKGNKGVSAFSNNISVPSEFIKVQLIVFPVMFTGFCS